jgi:hypothetical protein
VPNLLYALTIEVEMKTFSSKMLALTFILASALPVIAQTPQSSEMKAQLEAFTAQRHFWQKQGLNVFNKEMAREKIEPCPEAHSGYELNICLTKEIEISQSNYKTYADSIRALLALKFPGQDSINDNGPTGKPLSEEELLKEFDDIQSKWQQYQKAASNASFDYYKGGSIAPILAGQAELKIIRSHMHDLDAIYAMILEP